MTGKKFKFYMYKGCAMCEICNQISYKIFLKSKEK
jgi:hypothetical protein